MEGYKWEKKYYIYRRDIFVEEHIHIETQKGWLF